MTQTTLDPTQAGHRHPADLFMNFLVALLAPMFLAACGGDITLARMAAAETVNAHRIDTIADMLAVAQIIAFGFAALGSLCQSVGDDLSLSMVLRLRGNAVALNRAGERCRRALQTPAEDGAIRHNLPTIRQPQPEPTPPPAPAAEAEREPGAGLLTPDEVDQMLAAESEARLRNGFQDVAARRRANQSAANAAQLADAPLSAADEQRLLAWLAADKYETPQPRPAGANLPPTERKPASFRAAALGSTAHQPLTGARPTANRF
jgi:hypothetical protein